MFKGDIAEQGQKLMQMIGAAVGLLNELDKLILILHDLAIRHVNYGVMTEQMLLAAKASPISTVMDETYKVAITRFDNRIGVGGMAELAGFDLSLNQRRRGTLERVTESSFPNGGDIAKAEFWTGLRPMTPDGTPIIGRASDKPEHDNLWLNTGHDTLGWTVACGSAQILADLMSNQSPEIYAGDLNLSRYNTTIRTGKQSIE